MNSVPNGLLTSASQSRIAVAEGLTKGVADLELNIARGGYHGLKIEMKREEQVIVDGRIQLKRTYQRPEQKEWQKAVEEQGYLYVVIRSVDEFIKTITDYINGKSTDQGRAR